MENGGGSWYSGGGTGEGRGDFAPLIGQLDITPPCVSKVMMPLYTIDRYLGVKVDVVPFLVEAGLACIPG